VVPLISVAARCLIGHGSNSWYYTTPPQLKPRTVPGAKRRSWDGQKLFWTK